jgi:hypothetical protein
MKALESDVEYYTRTALGNALFNLVGASCEGQQAVIQIHPRKSAVFGR